MLNYTITLELDNGEIITESFEIEELNTMLDEQIFLLNEIVDLCRIHNIDKILNIEVKEEW